MRVLIMGMGVVGKATKQLLQENPSTQIFEYDPNVAGIEKMPDQNHTDAVFVCVNAVNNRDIQDRAALEECVAKGLLISANVFVRTTTIPGTVRDLNKKYSTCRIHHMPEYLREKDGYSSVDGMPVVTSCLNVELLKELFPKRELRLFSSEVCEFTKYVQNGFFALKVNYFNAVALMCDEMNIPYETVHAAVFATADVTGTITRECTRVPGPDGLNGFGGKCLPKDAEALRGWSGHNGLWTMHDLMDVTLRQNKMFRGEKT